MNRYVWTSILSVLILAGYADAQTATNSGDGSRAIAGRVLDHNGQPIANRKVYMHKVGGGPQAYREAETNEAGEFRFDRTASGVYQLSTIGAADEDRNKFYRLGEFVTLRVKKGGVITGTVTDSTGEPVIAARVQVTRVRDEDGRRTRSSILPVRMRQVERLTDDRGQYRIWGLPPGLYLVSAGGKQTHQQNRLPGPLDESAPTYHPSAATLDAAIEVRVQEGQEVTGINIRHRGESGHAISGRISGQIAGGAAQTVVGVILTQAATGALLDVKPAGPGENSQGFVFDGVADGEYYVTALRAAGGQSIDAASQSRRVVVKGEDVTGVELRVVPLVSVEGRLALEAAPKLSCRPTSTARLGEAVVIFHAEEAGPKLPNFTSPTLDVGDALGLPDEGGGFTIGPMRAGRYRVEARLPSKDWYISSVVLPGSAQSRPADVARDGIAVRSGERVTGLTIVIREGAASVRGRVALPQGKEAPAAGLRVHLIPAEPEQRDNVLRFAEADVEGQDSFRLTNITPGRYWLLVRPVGDVSVGSVPFLAWDPEERAKLVREAAAANNSIELKQCQQIADRVLSYAPVATKDLK